MSLNDYKAALEEQYQGEVTGEVAICGMLELFDSPEQRYLLGSMLQLETETKARLRPAVAKLGINLIESEAARASGEAIAGMLKGLDWQSAMRALENALLGPTARYREIAESAPAEFKELADSMVIHEELILNVARSEANGDADNSIDALIEHLVFPLPLPNEISR